MKRRSTLLVLSICALSATLATAAVGRATASNRPAVTVAIVPVCGVTALVTPCGLPTLR